jgi:isocitrate dehydrogenase
LEFVPGDTTVEKAMRVMRERKISSILVEPGPDGQWGIMTQKDVMSRIVHANRSPAQVKVEEVTTRPVFMLSADTSMHACVREMLKHNFRRVVVGKNGQPVGIVSDTDIFRLVEQFGYVPE